MRCLANLGVSSGRSANLEVIGLKGGGGGGVGKARLGRYRVNDDEWDGEWDDYSILFHIIFWIGDKSLEIQEDKAIWVGIVHDIGVNGISCGKPNN